MEGWGEVWEVTARSLYISSTATLLAALWSVPLAYYAAWRRSGLLPAVMEPLVGVPTVLVGLLLYMLLSRSGPLGFLGLLYTKEAIIVGQAVLVTPLLSSVAYRALREGVERYGEAAMSLGAGRRQVMATVLSHTAPGVAAAVAMAFSRAIGELGVAFMVGGNIKGLTRTLSTAIALSVSMGEYELALRLGAVLLALSVGFSTLVRVVVSRWLS